MCSTGTGDAGDQLIFSLNYTLMQPAPSTHKKLDIKYTLLASHGKIRIGQDRPDKSTIVYTHKRRKRLTTQLCYCPLTTERRNGRGREGMRLVWGGGGGQ